MYSVIMTDHNGISMKCSPKFGERFFTTKEFQSKLYGLRQLCFFLWGNMMSPEDQAVYYDNVTQLVFGLEEEAELAMVVKLTDRHGEKLTCLVRLRVIQNMEGKGGAFVIGVIPLPQSRHFKALTQGPVPAPSVSTAASEHKRKLEEVAPMASHPSPPVDKPSWSATSAASLPSSSPTLCPPPAKKPVLPPPQIAGPSSSLLAPLVVQVPRPPQPQQTTWSVTPPLQAPQVWTPQQAGGWSPSVPCTLPAPLGPQSAQPRQASSTASVPGWVGQERVTEDSNDQDLDSWCQSLLDGSMILPEAEGEDDLLLDEGFKGMPEQREYNDELVGLTSFLSPKDTT